MDFNVFVLVSFLLGIVVSIYSVNRNVITFIPAIESTFSIFIIINSIILFENGFLKSILIGVAVFVAIHIVCLCYVIFKKKIAFQVVKSISRNGTISKRLFKIFGKKNVCEWTKKTRNIKYGPRLKEGYAYMAGKKHAKTGVMFDCKGFPKFKSIYTVRLPMKYWKKDRDTHFRIASRKLYQKAMKDKKFAKQFTKKELQLFKKGEVPDRFTWHHHQDRGKLQLVLRSIHHKVKHKGGYSIWGLEEE